MLSVKSKHLLLGPRLYLREVLATDVSENYCRWMNDPEVTRYLESRFHSQTLEDIRAYVLQMQQSSDTLFLAILLKEKDTQIGNIKLGPINPNHRFADIGILIGEKTHWGKGYATEAIRLLSQYAFEKLQIHRLTAGAYANNPGSWRAFEKAGFLREATEHKKWLCEGRHVDGICLSLLQSQGHPHG